MGNYLSGKATEFGGINIKKRRADSIDGIRFGDDRGSQTFDASDVVLYRYGNDLYFWNGTANILIGAAGGGGSYTAPSLDQIFAGDQTLDLTSLSTLTIDRSSGNNDILTLTNTGAGSGQVVQITNVGTGKDISGTSATWSFSKAGDMVANMAVFAGDAGSNSLTLTAGDVVISDGSITLTDADNAASFSVTNNTATTASVVVVAGSGAFTGNTTSSFMTLTASGLTTGTALYIPVVALTTGKAINVVGTTALTTGILVNVESGTTGTSLTGAGRMFKSNHTGATTNSGILNEFLSAATDESTILQVTTSGALALGYALKMSTASVTTGTIVGILGAGVTTGSLISATDLAALTTGTGINLAHATSVIEDGGSMIRLASTGINTGGATNGTMLDIQTTSQVAGTQVLMKAGAVTTGVVLSLVSTTGLTSGSLLRATSSTAGAIATNGAISFTATGAFTTAAAVGFVSVQANTTTAGYIMDISGTALTTGVGLSIANGTSAMTTGSLLKVAASGTGTIATNGIVSIRHAGICLSTTNAGLVDVQASAAVGAMTLVNIKATAASQTATNLLNVAQSGATITAYTASLVSLTGGFSGNSSTGNVMLVTAVNTTAGDAIKVVSNALTLGAATMLNLSHTTSVLGAGTSMLRITSTGVDTGTTTGTLLDLAQTAAAGNVAVLLTDSSADTAARTNVKINVTNAAAIGVIPFEVQNAAVTGSNSKFKKIAKIGGVTLWVGIDGGGNTAQGQLTGTAGDICFNGGSNKPEYCTGTTNWTALV